jgi:FAD binding domain
MNTGIQDAWNLGWKLALVDRGVADEALLDSYQPERWPIGRFVLRFTDRATVIATGDTPVVRLIRTQIAPRLAPIGLRLSKPRAFGFRALSQLRINYTGSPAVQEGEPPLRRGPKAGDRLPDAHVVEHGGDRWLQDVLATPTYHLLLCGPAEDWDNDQLAQLSERYAGLVTVHRLARQAAADVTADVLHDVRGEALGRLGVEDVAHYLVRPDGHIGYRDGATDLHGVERYLARWLARAGAASS